MLYAQLCTVYDIIYDYGTLSNLQEQKLFVA